MTTWGGQFYYVAPFSNQSRELVWVNGRLPDFLGPLSEKYIDDIKESEMRIIFKTGSFIKLIGADNHQAGRGFNPDGAAYDEVKDHDPRFHAGFVKNLAAKKAPLVAVGTPPPEDDHFFWELEEDIANHPRGKVFIKSSYENPHVDHDEFRQEEKDAIRKGDYAEYQREILALRVRGGKNAIFPMLKLGDHDPLGKAYLGHTEHYVSYKKYIKKIQSNWKEWDLINLYDPGTTKCFAYLLLAFNKYTKEMVALDGIYETMQAKATTRQIYPRSMEVYRQVSKDWKSSRKIYDHAGAWFAAEVAQEYGDGLERCEKDLDNKENKLGLIKDALLGDYFKMTDRMYWLAWEMTNYYTDENGKIPKKNDHLIDLVRYGFNAVGFDTVPKEPFKATDEEDARSSRIELEDYGDFHDLEYQLEEAIYDY